MIINNILITGGTGQLGYELAKLLPSAFTPASSQLDITDQDLVNRFILEHNIQLIINCAAYTAVDLAETAPDEAAKVNAKGASNLAQTKVPIIHISTDYVFDGTSYKPYQTDDPTNPISVYGKTKLAGEQKVLKYASTALIIRTAWLYAARGKNFVNTILSLGRTKTALNVIDDQIGSPTFASDLAEAIVKIISLIKPGQKEIYHFTNEGVSSWYDFAKEAITLAGLNCRVNPIQTKDYPTKAQRPMYSVLSKAKIKQDFNLTIPHWKDSLARCLKTY